MRLYGLSMFAIAHIGVLCIIINATARFTNTTFYFTCTHTNTHATLSQHCRRIGYKKKTIETRICSASRESRSKGYWLPEIIVCRMVRSIGRDIPQRTHTHTHAYTNILTDNTQSAYACMPPTIHSRTCKLRHTNKNYYLLCG